MTFVDFSKSFDSIHRGNMMRILKAYAIPPNLLRAIEQIYTNTKARVKSPDGEMGVFEITADVLQGDTLALFSIVIGLDYAMRKSLTGKEEDLGFTLTPRTSRRQTEGVLSDLDFVDDISQLSDRDRVISRTSSQSWEHLIFNMIIRCYRLNARPWVFFLSFWTVFLLVFFFFGGGGGLYQRIRKQVYVLWICIFYNNYGYPLLQHCG